MTQVVTTHRDGSALVKPFSWSYSKLRNFEACPKQHFHVDLQKDFHRDESDALLHGNLLHKAAAERISKNKPLPTGMEYLEEWIVPIIGGTEVNATILVEQKLAITKEFDRCEFFDKKAWYRGVADVIKIVGPVALAVDWKTGKIIEDSVQLGLMAACIFSHFPDVQRIRTEFAWLAHDASSRVDFKREGMAQFWRDLWPRIEALEHAHITTTYPAKQGGLCKRWCPVTSCGYHGGN